MILKKRLHINGKIHDLMDIKDTGSMNITLDVQGGLKVVVF